MEKAEEHPKIRKEEKSFFQTWHLYVIGLIALLVVFNQWQISTVSATIGSSGFGSTLTSFSSGTNLLSGKSGVIIGPQLNPDGRTTKLVEWPTISPVTKLPKNPTTQDVIDYIVPKGTPEYAVNGPGAERIRGVSFDDPITSQKVWASLLGSKRFGTENAIELTPEEEQRWKKMVSIFTCDYCCGGPNSVTRINNCGCAHSYGWQGIAKFFIKYYPEYTDEQIMGEMTRWKGLWYPKGMIQDAMVYTGLASPDTLTHGGSVGIKAQFAGKEGQSSASIDDLGNLPGMVGGC